MKPKILIVDDEVAFAQILADRLSMHGYHAGYCPSGEEALTHIRKNPVDVVILDIMMPHMDGIVTLRSIKAVSALVEVILLSGEATLQTAIEGLRQGAFEYLTKPCDLSIMTAKIDAAFERKCSQEERIIKAVAEIDLILKKRE
jgi:DNA-binding response OmpR family regulator